MNSYDVHIDIGEYALVDDNVLVCSLSLPNASIVVDSSGMEGLLTVVGISLSLSLSSFNVADIFFVSCVEKHTRCWDHESVYCPLCGTAAV